MGLLDQFTQAVDARKRYYGNIVRGLLDNPQALMEQLRAQNAENVTERARSAQEAQSVMPGIAEPAQRAAFDEAINMGLLGITAYHGSPHKFDKFDMSKIGTGEGAQAYGHGLYFAENPGVAKSYQTALASQNTERTLADLGVPAEHVANASSALRQFTTAAEKGGLPWDRAAKNAQNSSIGLRSVPTDVLAEKMKRFAEQRKGAMYQVDIPDEAVAKMLDWDKPLSQQPESVRKALAGIKSAPIKDGMPLAGGGTLRIVSDPDFGPKYFLEMGGTKMRLSAGDVKNLVGSGVEGKSIYQALKEKLGSDDKVSAYLKKQGIPGIRYLDGGSRGKGNGTSNFVLFDDELPKIIGRE